MVEVQIAPQTIDINHAIFCVHYKSVVRSPSLSLAILSVLIIIVSARIVALKGGRRKILSLAYVLHVSR